ncbi:MAG TPA: ATP-binding protein, partial [Pirellulaceae bacterium]|nr:ATP-binding protein [Pirellulaceae bacterium]
VRPVFVEITTDFYAETAQHEATRRVFSGGETQVLRLKRTLIAWLEELFNGEYGPQYVARRWQVGLRHVEIGLDQQFTNVAMGRIRSQLVQRIGATWSSDAQSMLDAVGALNRLLDLDLAIIEDAYQYEYIQRQKRAERLIAIGQMASGIAHELRNPLNVVRTSVFYLQNARRPSPEKQVEHLERIQRQVGVADAVITALSDFAKLPMPQSVAVSVQALIDETLANVTLGPGFASQVELAPDLPPIRGDFRQLFIVLVNLVRNAVDAMPGGGTITISGRAEGERVELRVQDTGPGISSEDRQRIFEPFYSTKARGIGLGLAISRAIVDNHAGEIQVTSQPGEGACFKLWFPAWNERYSA